VTAGEGNKSEGTGHKNRFLFGQNLFAEEGCGDNTFIIGKYNILPRVNVYTTTANYI
jgi:hypothetical protein